MLRYIYVSVSFSLLGLSRAAPTAEATITTGTTTSATTATISAGATLSDGSYVCNPAHSYPAGETCVTTGTVPILSTIAASATVNCPYGTWTINPQAEASQIAEVLEYLNSTFYDSKFKGSAKFILDPGKNTTTFDYEAWDEAYSSDFTDGSTGLPDSLRTEWSVNGGGTATAKFDSDGETLHFTDPDYTGTFTSLTTYATGAPKKRTGTFDDAFGTSVTVKWFCDADTNTLGLNGLPEGETVYPLWSQLFSLSTGDT